MMPRKHHSDRFILEKATHGHINAFSCDSTGTNKYEKFLYREMTTHMHHGTIDDHIMNLIANKN
jgi:hypothetical protein